MRRGKVGLWLGWLLWLGSQVGIITSEAERSMHAQLYGVQAGSSADIASLITPIIILHCGILYVDSKHKDLDVRQKRTQVLLMHIAFVIM